MAPVSAHAVSYAGVEFPSGIVSFADVVSSYDLPAASDAPNAANSASEHVLGAPDYVSGGGCLVAATCTFASLGNGGSITVRFTDNVLTGGGNANDDLYVSKSARRSRRWTSKSASTDRTGSPSARWPAASRASTSTASAMA
jgi:hypothetical protein